MAKKVFTIGAATTAQKDEAMKSTLRREKKIYDEGTVLIIDGGDVVTVNGYVTPVLLAHREKGEPKSERIFLRSLITERYDLLGNKVPIQGTFNAMVLSNADKTIEEIFKLIKKNLKIKALEFSFDKRNSDGQVYTCTVNFWDIIE